MTLRSFEMGSYEQLYCAPLTTFVCCADGRRMFPAIQVQLSGLDRCARYVLALDVVPVNEFRYRFHASRWTVAGEAAAAAAVGDVTWHSRVYIHPDSPMTGQQWMNRSISFIRLKLTNNLKDNRGYVSIDFIQSPSLRF